jgi:hypothetical protein
MYRVAAPALALFLLAAAAPAIAHHSFAGKYDGGKVIALKGVISSLDYRNPHIFFSVNVAGKNGSGGTWRVQTESISKIEARGLSRQKLAPGTAVTVRGWPAKDGSAALGLHSITLPGGRTIKLRGTAR